MSPVGTDVAPGGRDSKGIDTTQIASGAGARSAGPDRTHRTQLTDEPQSAPSQVRAPWWRLDRRLRHWRLLKQSVGRGIMLFLVILVIEYLVLPQLAGAHKDLHLLGQVNVGFVLLAVALEIGSLVSYAALTRAVLPKGSASLTRLLRIDLSGVAVSHVLPGGTAGGTSVAYRLLTQAGVSGTDAGFGVATQGIGSAVVLNVILWLALVVSIGFQGLHNVLYVIAAIVGIVLFSAFGALIAALTRGAERSARILGTVARHLPWIKEEVVTALVMHVAARVGELGNDRPLLARAVAWATANWLLDAASLWVMLVAFHHIVDPDSLLVAYGIANVLAAIPITPGGLGIVEGVLIPSLVGFGTPRGIAILGVISYRLVNYWLPIPAGALAYLSLRLEPGGPRRRRAAKELRGLIERGSGPDPAGHTTPAPSGHSEG